MCIAGLFLGASYYLRPQRTVYRRIKRQQWEMAEKDPEFKKWLEAEIQVQTKRTQKMGMAIIILEAIWMVMIVGLWLKTR